MFQFSLQIILDTWRTQVESWHQKVIGKDEKIELNDFFVLILFLLMV